MPTSTKRRCFFVIISIIILKVGKVNNAKAFARAEKYANMYRKAEVEEIRMGKIAKSLDKYYVPAEPKLAVVVRIRG